MKKVFLNDNEVSFESCVSLMDDDIREEIHAEGIEDEQEFLDAYCDRHMEKYGEEFQI